MTGFEIVISCRNCGSRDIDTDLWMNQGTGLLQLECNKCGERLSASHDTESLQKEVSKHRRKPKQK